MRAIFTRRTISSWQSLLHRVHLSSYSPSLASRHPAASYITTYVKKVMQPSLTHEGSGSEGPYFVSVRRPWRLHLCRNPSMPSTPLAKIKRLPIQGKNVQINKLYTSSIRSSLASLYIAYARDSKTH